MRRIELPGEFFTDRRNLSLAGHLSGGLMAKDIQWDIIQRRIIELYLSPAETFMSVIIHQEVKLEK